MEAGGIEMTGGCRGQQKDAKVVKVYTVQAFNQRERAWCILST